MITQKKNKDLLEKQRNGYVGSPEKSNERFINKIFVLSCFVMLLTWLVANASALRGIGHSDGGGKAATG